jgi:HK97 family phage portal protein
MNPEHAMRMVPVWGAVRFLADNIAAMAPGLGLYKLAKGGSGPAQEGDLAVRQPTPSLFANPSIHGTLVDWLHRAVVSMALQGDGIGLMTQRDYTNLPTMIEWLNPINVVTMDRAIEGPGSYVDPRWYWWGRPMDPKDLLHIPLFPRPWRVRGLAPVTAYATTVGVGLAAMEYGKEWYDKGGVPPGTFRNTTQKVLPEDADEIADRYVRRLRSRKPLIYGMDWEYNPISISPHEAKFLDTMQATATNIAVIYGVPPHKIGGLTGDSLTYATVEQESLDCLTYTFRPWLVRFEYAFSTCFPRGYFVRFDANEFLRVDAKTRAEIDALSLGTVQTGWKDQNEVRASYNLPPRKLPTPEPAPATGGGAGQAAKPPGGPQPGASSANTQGTPMMRDRAAANGHSTNGHATAPAKPLR